jgi:hypothetical protein
MFERVSIAEISLGRNPTFISARTLESNLKVNANVDDGHPCFSKGKPEGEREREERTGGAERGPERRRTRSPTP